MHPITTIALDKVLTFLAPLFLQQTNGNLQAARHAASQTLTAHAARSDQEVRLVALIIAFSFRALDALSRAADPELDVKAVLRLNGSANALNRAAQQCQRTLDRMRRIDVNKAETPDTAPELADIPLTNEVAGLFKFMQSALRKPDASTETCPDTAPLGLQPMSRQQRRAAERQAEKALRRQQDADRLAARAASLAAQTDAHRTLVTAD
jgi:hypothetical protein